MKLRPHQKVIATLAVIAAVGLAVSPAPRVGPNYIYADVSGVTNSDITQDNISQNICAGRAWSTSSIRPPTSYTNPIKVTALARYNQEYKTSYKMSDGELDHVISIEVGGSPTHVNNLAFEPYITQIDGVQVGAHEKDKVENEIHRQICAGTLTLAQGQDILSKGDWYKFYLNMTKGFGGIGYDDTDLDDN